MTRTLLAIAAALVAATTFITSDAKACISCEYVPPVVNTPVYSHGAKVYKRSRTRAAVKVHRERRAKKQIVETKRKARPVATAKAAEPVEAVEPAKVEAKVESENSAISTASIDKSETAELEPVKADEPKASKNVGCKKFFPTVGMTLTVPCE